MVSNHKRTSRKTLPEKRLVKLSLRVLHFIHLKLRVITQKYGPLIPEDEAEDLAQETWLRFLMRRTTDPVNNEEAYLIKAAMNVIRERLRTEGSQRNIRVVQRDAIFRLNPHSITSSDEDMNDADDND